VVNFLDTDGLTGEGSAEVDLLVIGAETSAAGDHEGAVVEGVVRFGEASIGGERKASRPRPGRGIRILAIVDAFTRECLTLEVDTSLSSQRVTRALEQVMEQRGMPESIRCDNGPELTSRHFLGWCEERKAQLIHIQPGRPMQNGHVESFNGRLRKGESPRIPQPVESCFANSKVFLGFPRITNIKLGWADDASVRD
jgi:transposase InsO family protein